MEGDTKAHFVIASPGVHVGRAIAVVIRRQAKAQLESIVIRPHLVLQCGPQVDPPARRSENDHELRPAAVEITSDDRGRILERLYKERTKCNGIPLDGWRADGEISLIDRLACQVGNVKTEKGAMRAILIVVANVERL